MIPPGPIPNTAWTATGTVVRVGTNRKVECRCTCGEVKMVLETRLKAGQTRSCGCLRGQHVQESRAASPVLCDVGGTYLPPNGYAVVLEGSVRGEKWAAGSPELQDPWYVGPRESDAALRFGSRRLAREWIARRRESVRFPGTMTVVPLAFSDGARRWTMERPESVTVGVDSSES